MKDTKNELLQKIRETDSGRKKRSVSSSIMDVSSERQMPDTKRIKLESLPKISFLNKLNEPRVGAQ